MVAAGPAIRDGTAISYRVLVDYGEEFGSLQVVGDNQGGTVSASNDTFSGVVGTVRLRARDQNDDNVAGASVQLVDALGRRSGFHPVATELLLPLPGDYTPLGRVELVESDGTGVSIDSGSARDVAIQCFARPAPAR